MSAAMAGPVSDAVLMTLAGIAYVAPDQIAHYLNIAEPTAGDWSVNWLAAPPDPPVNFAYIAVSARTNAYVLAIRGTYPDPFSPAYWDDSDQDSPFGPMSDWPGAPGVRISGGTAKGLAGLLALTDQNAVTIVAAVAALPAGASLTITGHSLGGTLAPVLALHLAETFPGRDLYVASFAGMTPGNQAFAELFGSGSRLDGRVRRVFNTIDSVAYGWDKVFATHDFFDPAPKGGVVVSAMLLATAARLALDGYDFTAVGDPVPLPGIVRPVSIGCELIAYVVETLYQHMPDTYLALLGAPPLPFSIVFANVVVPRGHLAGRTQPAPHPAVIYLE
jgi:hypothetical protein